MIVGYRFGDLERQFLVGNRADVNSLPRAIGMFWWLRRSRDGWVSVGRMVRRNSTIFAKPMISLGNLSEHRVAPGLRNSGFCGVCIGRQFGHSGNGSRGDWELSSMKNSIDQRFRVSGKSSIESMMSS